MSATDATQAAAERAAYQAGAAKARSLAPGKPRTEAAHLPTAAEREAYVAGWCGARRAEYTASQLAAGRRARAATTHQLAAARLVDARTRQAQAMAYLLATADVPAPSPAPRPVRIAVAQSVVRGVLVAEGRYRATARAVCRHAAEQWLPTKGTERNVQGDRLVRGYWCSGCGQQATTEPQGA